MIRFFSFPFALCLFLIASAQTKDEIRQLDQSHPIERQIAGGETHSYQVSLNQGQFARFTVTQQSIDTSLILRTLDGKQIAQSNLTEVGPETLGLEAPVAGNYLVLVRGNGGTAMRGSYRLEATVRVSNPLQDRKYLAAQTFVLDAQDLTKQFPNTAPQAVEKLEQSLPLWRELNEPFWTALTLNKIARAQMSLNQHDKAISACEQALLIQRESKNRLGEAIVLSTVGAAYLNLRQFDKARENFENSLGAYREVKQRRAEGQILQSLARASSNLNQPEKAVAYLEGALVIFRELKDRTSEGNALLSLGNVYLNRGQSEKVIETVSPALIIFQELQDKSGQGMARNNLGIAYGRMGKTENAIENLTQARSLFREMNQKVQEGSVVNALGSAYGEVGQTERAIEYFEEGLAISRTLKNRDGECRGLSNIALAYIFLSQYEKAIEYLEQALIISREIKARQLEGNAYSNLGAAYGKLSRFEKSIESQEQALAIFREVKYTLGEGNTLQDLGGTYQSLGRDDKALEYFQQALTLFRETKFRVGEGDALSNVGGCYDRLGRFEDAIRSHEQALAIYRELKYAVGQGSSLMNLGVVYARQNQPEKALNFYDQALVILRAAKERNSEGLTLFRMAEAKGKLGRPDEAAALFNESVNVMRSIGNRSGEVDSLTALARLEGTRGNLTQARTLVENSLQIAESLRSDLVSSESRASFMANVQSSYQLYIDLLMRQKQGSESGLAALAFETSERQRARSLLDLLAESRTDLRQGVDAPLITRERSLNKQLDDKAQQVAQASNRESAAKLKQELSQLETDLERAQADIRKASPRYAALTQPQPLKINEIQKQLDADTLLLEYSLGEERSYLWAISKDSVSSYELPGEKEIKQNALALYEVLTVRSNSERGESVQQRNQRIQQAEAKISNIAQALSRTVLAPVADQLGNKRLVIVADGALQYIPFAMLPDPRSLASSLDSAKLKDLRTKIQQQPLVVNHEIISLPSASALALQRTELANRAPAPKMLAVIADPVFDRTDGRLGKAATESNELPQPQTINPNDARRIEHLAETADGKNGVPMRRFVIPRLPFTRLEATRLLALTPKNTSLGAMDFEASRATVLSGELSQYRYLHFATHGLLDSERPGLSSLVLSMVDQQGKPLDGFLRTNDIYNLKLPAELVVLSACQTGLGKEVKGEGLVGLTRGFMYAGAARVVVSLWSVNDKATAELMAKFYEKMLAQGQRPAAALRAAQVEMWKQKQWRSPYYWAAFTMQGEWR